MRTAYWGMTGEIGAAWPDNAAGWLLLFCYAAIFGWLLIRGREAFRRLSGKQVLLLIGLSGGGLLLSQALPTTVPAWLAQYWPNYGGDGPQIGVALLAAVPYLLAGAILGPAPALIAGLFTGLGYALGETHELYALFHFAFAAYLAALLMQQNYMGRFYAGLRLPLTGGVVGQTSTAVFAALAALINSSALRSALDVALTAFHTQFWPMFASGLISGGLVTVIMIGLKPWLPARRLVPTPGQRSVRSYLRRSVLSYDSLFLLFSAILIVALSVALATRLLVTEMAASSNTATMQLEAFRSELEDVLAQSSGDEDFMWGDKASAARGLGRLYRNGKHFEEVMLVDEQLASIYDFPAQETERLLAESEREALTRALKDGRKTPLIVFLPDKGRMFSVVMPVQTLGGQPRRALIGRVPVFKLNGIINDFLIDHGRSFILDAEEHLLATAGSSMAAGWSHPVDSGAKRLFVPAHLGGEAFLMEDEDGSRDIYYISPPNGLAWRVVTTLPYENVLNRAFGNAVLVMLGLIGLTAVFYASFNSYGKNLASQISELARASRSIAGGGDLTTTVDVDRQDEVGELGRAFTGMQRALKGRLDELSLLLAISQDVSTSIDINQSMPLILRGAVRGTGAVGARAVILNPNGRAPLAFAEGPAAEKMRVLDRTLMASSGDRKELALISPLWMEAMFGLPERGLPVKALYAIRLQSQNEFHGVFYVGYGQPREFDKNERDLLHTLAGQAAVLVENALLFARAESGRQRLTAVLSSTSEAVLVTDQMERVFMLNKAMEEAFQIVPGQANGRLVGDVINSQPLVKALKLADVEQRDLEVVGKDGRHYYAKVSPIVSRNRRLMGRVAVLHDVTRFKEVDRLKSEFVDDVSHDLRTPLTIISHSVAELTMSDGFADEQRKFTDNILASVERMVRLLDTMLELGQLESGKELVYETFHVGALLEELAEDQWLYARKSGLTIRTKTAAGLPPITADRDWLYQALENLLSNAFKYAPNSGELLLSAAPRGDMMVISLRDRGPGIAAPDQIQLFEKGYRVKRHGSGEVKGNGLGLALVKKVAERHGGTAWCRSEVGKGSVFGITVPVVAGEKN